ncbi:augmin complex subunit wac [Drosophila montana]|uniref:augmin complex subunit wac n=1 Tax=Drosophila montana TaxID=40370 RepID=UPI00313CFB54
MDNLKLQDEVKALKNFGDHLEQMLKLISFEVCDLPDDVLMLLDKCVEIQAYGQLNDLNINYLREFYYTKKRENIENKLTVAQQSATLKKLRGSIKEADEEIAALERFTSTVSKRLISATELQRNITQIAGKSKGLLDRLKGLKVPDDFNIEAVIEKIDMLERSK